MFTGVKDLAVVHCQKNATKRKEKGKTYNMNEVKILVQVENQTSQFTSELKKKTVSYSSTKNRNLNLPGLNTGPTGTYS